jgi:hypothetical protein
MFTIEALTAVLTDIILPAVFVIFLTFVPSILEWKRPRDAGPRPIPGFYKTGTVTTRSNLLDLDAEHGALLTPKSFIFPGFIYNIEAVTT